MKNNITQSIKFIIVIIMVIPLALLRAITYMLQGLLTGIHAILDAIDKWAEKNDLWKVS